LNNSSLEDALAEVMTVTARRRAQKSKVLKREDLQKELVPPHLREPPTADGGSYSFASGVWFASTVFMQQGKISTAAILILILHEIFFNRQR